VSFTIAADLAGAVWYESYEIRGHILMSGTPEPVIVFMWPVTG
jgi:hypothetical protein